MRNPKDKDEVLDNCDFYYDGITNYDNNNTKLYLEIGMGKGNFIQGMAKNFKNVNFIGMEKYSAVASLAIKKLAEDKLDNVKVMVMDVINSVELLENKIDKIYLNFSDPWPKDRHAKRRLSHENQLKVYDKLFKGKKVIEMKTDNDDLFEFSVNSFKEYGYVVKEISYDLHSLDKFNIMTEYEEKFSSMGVKIKYVLVEKE